MKWIPQDIDTYLSAKEYIDTAIIPLYSISFGEEIKQSAANAEFITLLTNYLERQFTGRLVLIPSFIYLKNEKLEDAINDLKKWEESIVKNEFKHIFYITSESEWKLQDEGLNGSVIWVPSLPLENMSEPQKISIMDSQTKQLFNLFEKKWHEI
jgi:hypothetical protein